MNRKTNQDILYLLLYFFMFKMLKNINVINLCERSKKLDLDDLKDCVTACELQIWSFFI